MSVRLSGCATLNDDAHAVASLGSRKRPSLILLGSCLCHSLTPYRSKTAAGNNFLLHGIGPSRSTPTCRKPKSALDRECVVRYRPRGSQTTPNNGGVVLSIRESRPEQASTGWAQIRLVARDGRERSSFDDQGAMVRIAKKAVTIAATCALLVGTGMTSAAFAAGAGGGNFTCTMSGIPGWGTVTSKYDHPTSAHWATATGKGVQTTHKPAGEVAIAKIGRDARGNACNWGKS